MKDYTIILPDTGEDLLRQELEIGFLSHGLKVLRIHPQNLHNPNSHLYLKKLSDYAPLLLFCVNFQGSGKLKETLKTLQTTGSIMAAWFVDNPWNILSTIKEPQWKKIPLYVTDNSFIRPLMHHGATHVSHLPLAASPEVFSPHLQKNHSDKAINLSPAVFVGRSSFPGKKKYFEGIELPSHILEKAITCLKGYSEHIRPDIFWWQQELGSNSDIFWPGKKQRISSFGAETASLSWRNMSLRAVVKAVTKMFLPSENTKNNFTALDIFGDSDWGKALPQNSRLLPPVDYYTNLPQIYNKAHFSVCLTSLQLPRGLNQRHFDVWTAEGCLLSDATPGLDIFPQDLTSPITFHSLKEIPTTLNTIEKNRKSLILNWKNYLLDNHTYSHRILTLLADLDSIDT